MVTRLSYFYNKISCTGKEALGHRKQIKKYDS